MNRFEMWLKKILIGNCFFMLLPAVLMTEEGVTIAWFNWQKTIVDWSGEWE